MIVSQVLAVWEAVEPLRNGALVEGVAHGGGGLAWGELTGGH